MLAQLAARSALLIAEGVPPPVLTCPKCEALSCTTTIAAKVPFGPGLNDDIGSRADLVAHAGVRANMTLVPLDVVTGIERPFGMTTAPPYCHSQIGGTIGVEIASSLLWGRSTCEPTFACRAPCRAR